MHGAASLSHDDRLIYLEPTWKLHSAYEGLMRHPPDGYRFEAERGRESTAIKAASRFALTYSWFLGLNRVVPLYLLQAARNMLKRPPAGTALTYSIGHLVLRNEPWVLDLPCEHVTNALGGLQHYCRFGWLARRALSSDGCRRIIVTIEAARRAVEATLGPHLAAKTEVVHWAVGPKQFAKEFSGDAVKLLFVNSGNIPGQFHTKGGKEAIEAFFLLRERYPHLELVVRSDVPAGIKKRCAQMDGVRVLDKVVPWAELEREFITADIFLLPAHHTPMVAFLDAMSYELPVVTTDAWGNGEMVADGKTGLLVHDNAVSRHYEWMLSRCFIPPAGSRPYRDIVNSTDHEMVRELVSKLSLLIEDAELRRRLGRAGRWAVEEGRFSLRQRNARLKCVLDEALDPNGR